MTRLIRPEGTTADDLRFSRRAALAGSLIFAEPVDFWVLLGGGLILSAISWVTFAERTAAQSDA